MTDDNAPGWRPIESAKGPREKQAASATGAPTIKRGLKVRSPRQHHRDDRHAQPVQQGELEGHESARRHASPHVARCGLPGRQLRT